MESSSSRLFIRRVDGKRTDCLKYEGYPIVLMTVYFESQMREEMKQWDISAHNGFLLYDHRFATEFQNYLEGMNRGKEGK